MMLHFDFFLKILKCIFLTIPLTVSLLSGRFDIVLLGLWEENHSYFSNYSLVLVTSFIDGFWHRCVVVLHGVLSQLESVQTTDGLVSSGPVKHHIIDVVAPCTQKINLWISCTTIFMYLMYQQRLSGTFKPSTDLNGNLDIPPTTFKANGSALKEYTFWTWEF